MSLGRTLDVGIIGSGTAGSAAALFLARAGHRVTLYERVPEPGAVGAGILLQPTGMAVLARLGLLERVAARGSRVEKLHAQAPSGRTVLHLEYAQLAPGLFGLGLHRGVLFEAFHAALADSSVTLRLGVEVSRISAEARGRRQLRGPRDELLGSHQLVLVADGARSTLREQVVLPSRVKRYPWGALWHVTEAPAGGHPDTLFQVVHGTRELLGFLPTGLGPSTGAGRPLVSLFWSLREAELAEWRTAGLAVWKRRVLALWPGAGALLDALTHEAQLTFAPYWDVVMPELHAGGSLAVLGDAGHAMSPQLGQGTNLALADAATLAECLERSESTAEALTRYSRLRREPLTFYTWATRLLTPFFQSSLSPLGPLRDTAMPLMCAVGPLRTQMIRSMAGMQRGLLASPVPLAALEPARSARTRV